MRILFILFIILPILEIYVLLQVGGLIGPIPTIIIILLTAVLGYQLFRAQGIEKLHTIRSSLNGANRKEGESLAMDIAEGAAILVAGVLLLTPGFVTDAFGFACLFPPTRKILIKKFLNRSIIHVNTNGSFHASSSQQAKPNASNSNSPNIIEGEYKEKE